MSTLICEDFRSLFGERASRSESDCSNEYCLFICVDLSSGLRPLDQLSVASVNDLHATLRDGTRPTTGSGRP